MISKLLFKQNWPQQSAAAENQCFPNYSTTELLFISCKHPVVLWSQFQQHSRKAEINFLASAVEQIAVKTWISGSARNHLNSVGWCSPPFEMSPRILCWLPVPDGRDVNQCTGNYVGKSKLLLPLLPISHEAHCVDFCNFAQRDWFSFRNAISPRGKGAAV